MKASPFLAGRTGDRVFVANADGRVLGEYEHPDADMERARMFQEIQGIGRQWIADLVSRGAAKRDGLVRAALNRHLLPEVFADLNANQDDVLSIGELRDTVLTLDARRFPVADLLAPMQLGAGGEDVLLIPGLSLREARESAAGDAFGWLGGGR